MTIINIEGADGQGKTSYCTYLSHVLNIPVIFEPTSGPSTLFSQALYLNTKTNELEVNPASLHQIIAAKLGYQPEFVIIERLFSQLSRSSFKLFFKPVPSIICQDSGIHTILVDRGLWQSIKNRFLHKGLYKTILLVWHYFLLRKSRIRNNWSIAQQFTPFH